MTNSREVAELAQRNAPWLLGWFRVRGVSADVAEDLVQETLLRLVRNLKGLRSRHAVPAWLRTTAQDLLTRHRRKRWPVALAHEPVAADTAEDQRLEALRSAISGLPQELEEIVLVRYSGELTYEQVAEALGLTRATVQSRLRRALDLLRTRLERTQTETT